MSEPMDDVIAQLAQADAMLKAIPGAEDILRNAASPEEAMRRLTELLTKNPEGMAALVPVAQSFSDSIQKAMNEGPPPVFTAPSGEVKWNPLVEAGILERMEIDGDVPELRTGPLPEGAKPAIPVKTRSIDPVFVGLQLKKTSEMAAASFALAAEEHRALCDQIQEDASKAGLLPAVVADLLPPVPTGIKGYEAGRVPAPWEPEPVSPLDTLGLSKDEISELAWLAIATTQGRRSLAPVIEQTVVDNAPDGISIRVMGKAHRPEKAASVIWACQVFGSGDLNPEFNPAMAAVVSFTQTLVKSGLTGPVGIYIEPMNGTADRRFGWVLHYWKVT